MDSIILHFWQRWQGRHGAIALSLRERARVRAERDLDTPGADVLGNCPHPSPLPEGEETTVDAAIFP